MIDLSQYQELIVRQEVEHFEAFTGFETENQYSVLTVDGEVLLHAAEESGMLGRQFLGNHRPMTLHVVDADGNPVMTASRAFFWLLSHLHVEDADGRPIGSLQRRFGFLKRVFSLSDAGGGELARVEGKMLRPNTFMIYRQGDEIGRVTKQWSGIGREAFTDADTFHVQMNTEVADQPFALLVIATALAIDLDFFESKGSSMGGGF